MADGGKSPNRIYDVEQMLVYGVFLQLALDIEAATRSFAPDFRWLRVQCLRSSESVCANMTEGFYSQYSTEYMQSLYRCRREARETITHIRYALGVKQLSEIDGTTLISKYEEALLQLTSLIGSIERKIAHRGKAKDTSIQIREEEEEYSAKL